MSIIVEKLTKIYAGQKALDEVSFEVKPGNIVGLLGPNGAGKSTIMKILTCFIPPTSGKATINGYDIFEDSLQIRKIIGYLPEHNPLYQEMYVKEYLEFVGGIHKIKGLSERIARIIELTGLEVERRKKIGQLSKGYRQRVGLAQALIHDPEILILDEPTSGLDPNQLVEIRNLIKTIGREKTVMLSTHIMQEVEAICNHTIIINKGKIVANDTTENLRPGVQSSEALLVEFDRVVEERQLMAVKGVKSALPSGKNSWVLMAESTEDLRTAMFDFAVSNQMKILSLTKKEKSLEEIFMDLTKSTE
jgi:ABC-2 type transport system ATP-binding protein